MTQADCTVLSGRKLFLIETIAPPTKNPRTNLKLENRMYFQKMIKVQSSIGKLIKVQSSIGSSMIRTILCIQKKEVVMQMVQPCSISPI